MRGRRPFERAKNEKTPDSNLMICRAVVDGRAVFMWNISGTLVLCQQPSDFRRKSAHRRLRAPIPVVCETVAHSQKLPSLIR